MSEIYENLIKLHYKKENVEKEFENRKNSPVTFNTGLFINPISKDKKIMDTSLELFYLPIHEISFLQEKIYLNSREIIELSSELPLIGKDACIREMMINEIIKTNSVEGINTTKKEIHSSMQSKKVDRLSGIIKKYEQIIENNIDKINSVEDFRKIYDEIFEEDILKNSENKLDGKLFRKNNIYINNEIGNIIHIEVSKEEQIINYLENLIKFMNDKNISFIIKGIVTHYYFEYIHPFYDGNGRFGRFIFSMYLSRKLDIFTGLSLSYGIFLEKNKYSKLFQETSNPKNYGEITFFIKGMLEIILVGQDSVKEMLNKKIFKLKKIFEYIENLELPEVEENILSIYAQDYIFSEYSFLTDVNLLSYIPNIKNIKTLKKYIENLKEKGYVEKINKNPSHHIVSEKIKEILE